jgi:hypothetical protein
MQKTEIILIFSFSHTNYQEANNVAEKLNSKSNNIYHFVRKINDKYRILFKYVDNLQNKIIIKI